jgi:predicted dehydrogenase
VKKLRIGVVGLGGIAQKAWLPVGGRDGLDAARGVVAHPRKSRAYLRNLAHPYAALGIWPASVMRSLCIPQRQPTIRW